MTSGEWSHLSLGVMNRMGEVSLKRVGAFECPLKVLYVITRAEPGGAQVHLLDLLNAFHSRFRLSLAVGEDGYLVRKARELGVETCLVPGLTQLFALRKDCKAFLHLNRLVRKVKPDLIHAHSSKAGLLGRLAAKLAGVPSIFTAHGWAFADGTPRIQQLLALPGERLAARFCQKIITVSKADYLLAESSRIAPQSKIVVIHNGIGDNSFRARPQGEIGRPLRIVSVARFARQKDQATLLRALAGLQFDYRLLLVGDGPTRTQVQAQATQLALSDHVEFLGARDDVAQILANAHIFALATNWEGFPISILEAMRAGLPVVASSVGGVGEAVVDGETGFLVPRGDEKAVRMRLSQLLAAPVLRSQMGAAGRRRFEQLFSQEGMLDRTLGIYLEVLEASRVGRSSWFSTTA